MVVGPEEKLLGIWSLLLQVGELQKQPHYGTDFQPETS